MLGDGAEVALLHQAPRDVVLHLAAKALLENATRHFARTEARESDALAQGVVGAAQLGGHLCRLDLNGELSLDGGQRFDVDLHGEPTALRVAGHAVNVKWAARGKALKRYPAPPGKGTWARRDSNPHALGASAPKADVSTSSTTGPSALLPRL